MAEDTLYRAAYAYYGTKLWKDLRDSELFALRYPGNQIGYCCVMGMAGNHTALALYMGEEALASLYQVALGELADSGDMAFDVLMSQDCLMCSFEKKGELEPEDFKAMDESGFHFKAGALPLLRQYKPGFVPWFINDPTDRQRLEAALLAAVEVANRLPRKEKQLSLLDTGSLPIVKTREELGFSKGIIPGKSLPLLTQTEEGYAWDVMALPGRKQMDYPEPAPGDELRVARLKRKGLKKGLTLECGVLSVPLPVADERGNGFAPYFPVMVMALDNRGDREPMKPISFQPGIGEGDALERFIDYLEAHGVPEQILVQDMRAMGFFRHLAQSLGIKLVYVDALPNYGVLTSKLMKSLLKGMEGIDLDSDSQWEEEEEDDTAREDPRKEEHLRWNDAIKTDGVCTGCGKAVPRAVMLRHIKGCLIKPEEAGEQRYFLLNVQGAEDPNYFLYLSVKANAALKDLDEYLRDIWLECCGHMSMFTIGGLDYSSYDPEPGQSMAVKLSSVLEKGLAFRHEYDFGSTTRLKIKVAEDYRAAQRRQKIVLFARNREPMYKCVACGKPARWVDQSDWHPVPGSCFCDGCIGLLEDPELVLPLVNSPRCGVCGYGG